MKKILLTFVAAFLMGTTAVNAQKWGGQFIVRGGFATNNFKGEHTRGIDMLPSYNIGVDFNKTFHKGAYWNTGLMLGTRGFDVDKSSAKFRAHNFNIPFTLGYKYDLTDNLALDGRFGAFFGVDMAGKYKLGDEDVKIGDIDHYKRCDGGIMLGLGVWFKRVNFDYLFKRGFGEVRDEGPAGAVNHTIRIGYAF